MLQIFPFLHFYDLNKLAKETAETLVSTAYATKLDFQYSNHESSKLYFHANSNESECTFSRMFCFCLKKHGLCNIEL